MTYVITKSNDNDNTLSISITDPNGAVQDADIKISADKKNITETIYILSIKVSEANYNYVDGKTKP